MRKVILLSFLVLTLGFLVGFSRTPEVKAESYNCTSRPSECSSTTDYPECKGNTPYTECQQLGGCFFNSGSDGSGGPYCAYKEGSPPNPNYNCENRDPRCPKSTHDCYQFGTNCNRSTDCLTYDSSTGKQYCAYLKGNPPVKSCLAKDTSCDPSMKTNLCCDGLECNREGDERTGFCRTVPDDFGPTCYKCAEGSSWDGTKCVNSSGNEVAPESRNYCGTGGQCEQGQGCSTFGTEPNRPLTLPCNPSNPAQYNREKGCLKIHTAIGDIDTQANEFVRWVLGFVLSLSGGIVLIIIIISGYRIMTSQGDPEKVKNARDQLTAAIVGLLFIIFSLVILELITRDILGLPGFGSP